MSPTYKIKSCGYESHTECLHAYITERLEADGAAAIPLKCLKNGCKKPIHLNDLLDGGTNEAPEDPN